MVATPHSTKSRVMTVSATIEWGTLFNDGQTAVGVFANYLHRDRVNSQDDPRWANADFR